jgi:3-hydroxyisobutyrate dehydrogenase
MGRRLAESLLHQGLPVIVFNRTRGKDRALENAGATVVDSSREVGCKSNFLFTAVTGPNDVRDVLLGPSGVSKSGNRNLIVIDLSTIDPTSSRAIAKELKELRMDMLDSPMSGSVHDAETGSLGLLVGGRTTVLAKARPILERLGKIYHFGPNGSGCAAKLALNLLLGAMVQSLGEAFAVLNSQAISPDLFLLAIGTSGLSSPLFERVGERILNRDFEPRYSLRHLQKDLSLLDDVSKQAGLDLRVAQLLKRIVTRMSPELLDADYSVLASAEVDRILRRRLQR